ncbi:MAG: hypothetical protein KC503_06020 [Myxococcales bacterium]|nr:hypothetical protein [Myxococcales bacterium]
MAYVLPCDITLDELEKLDEIIDGTAQIDEFSKFVAGAADHFKFRLSQFSLAAGTIGGRSLVVTYGKLGAAAAPRDREWVERYITRRYGPITLA